jgi:hypothetical protein
MSRFLVVLAVGLLPALAACSAADRADSNHASQAAVGDEPTNTPVDVTNEPVVGGPRNGGCADALGELVYTASAFEGGAPPPPGSPIGEQKLVYKGNVAGLTVLHAPGATNGGNDGDQDQPWEITLRFDDASKTVLESTGNRSAGSETYAQKVQGTLVRGLGPSIESNQFTTFVICTDHWNFLLP